VPIIGDYVAGLDKAKAITATAHKLARLIYTMLTLLRPFNIFSKTNVLVLLLERTCR
jgi:hypothetical protein